MKYIYIKKCFLRIKFIILILFIIFGIRFVLFGIFKYEILTNKNDNILRSKV